MNLRDTNVLNDDGEDLVVENPSL